MKMLRPMCACALAASASLLTGCVVAPVAPGGYYAAPVYSAPAYYAPAPVVVTPSVNVWGGYGYRGGYYGRRGWR